jgi:hypothetical protein
MSIILFFYVILFDIRQDVIQKEGKTNPIH